jgi:hypothetical protein
VSAGAAAGLAVTIPGMHKRALTLILPVFMAVSFGLVASGCDDKADKKEKEDKPETKKVDEKKEEKADGGW